MLTPWSNRYASSNISTMVNNLKRWHSIDYIKIDFGVFPSWKAFEINSSCLDKGLLSLINITYLLQPQFRFRGKEDKQRDKIKSNNVKFRLYFETFDRNLPSTLGWDSRMHQSFRTLRGVRKIVFMSVMLIRKWSMITREMSQFSVSCNKYLQQSEYIGNCNSILPA